MRDTRDPLLLLRAATAARQAAGLRRTLRPRAPGPDGVVDLASNDYLGLAANPVIAAGAATGTRFLDDRRHPARPAPGADDRNTPGNAGCAG